MRSRYDVLIVGGGPAGLSAALWLGRCQRRTLLCDAGRPRNSASHGLHGFLTRDATPPAEFNRMGREQLAVYPSVEIRDTEVLDAAHAPHGFDVTLAVDHRVSCRKLLLATGVKDILPEIPHFADYYGRSIFHCPYCDGWEMRGKRLALLASGQAALDVGLLLRLWSDSVTITSHGAAELNAEERSRLARHNIAVREDLITGLEGEDGCLNALVFESGERLPCDGLFFSTGKYQHSPLAAKLGCKFEDEGCVAVGKYQATNVPNLFVAGDASGSMQLAVVAAAEGTQAAIAINKALLAEDTA
ncbi:MAG TPA: NAD(P)/FAD-dependent oxidoreductase [Planctomycetota bacterium]|nr:NAD(P)/FAD-dependent oxidoreductase [Planctomycetota bacterium]